MKYKNIWKELLEQYQKDLIVPIVGQANLNAVGDCCVFPSLIKLGDRTVCETCNAAFFEPTKSITYDHFYQTPPVKAKVCNCGALHTSKVNTHSPWCDIATTWKVTK